MSSNPASKPVRNLVVIGLGLIGGSLAAAAKQRGLCEKVYGVARRAEVCERACELGVVDEATTELASISSRLGKGDVIFIAVPTLTVSKVLADIKSCINSEVTITDGASVKGSVLDDAIAVWGAVPPQLVLGHPIAGSEKSGVEASNPELYDNHRVILTPTEETGIEHIDLVTVLWQGAGAEVLQLSVKDHDEILAATSHLPHVIAYSLVDTLAHDSQNQNIFRYAAGGFRDFTRIASSDATMWRDIMLANQASILHAIDLFTRNLNELRTAIENSDSKELMGIFSRAKAARDHFTKMLNQRSYVDQGDAPSAYKVTASGPVTGVLTVPGDKSISHRAVLLGAIAEGETHIDGFLESEDALATIQAVRDMGVVVEGPSNGRVTVYGVGLNGLKAPASPIYVGGSGTTMRLLVGLLAAQTFDAELIGDKPLTQKSMTTVVEPIKLMGAAVELGAQGTSPIYIKGGQSLAGISYQLPVASGQVKSALLLAGLYASGETAVAEPTQARDHTERMLAVFGVDVQRKQNVISVLSGQTLKGVDIQIPGDFSAALFFIAAAAVTPESDITLRQVGINPTRSGAIAVLQSFGANIELLHKREAAGEPVADIRVRYAPLHAAKLTSEQVNALLDEFPLVLAVAAYAAGSSILESTTMLTNKEAKRLNSLLQGLNKLGVKTQVSANQITIEGGHQLQAVELDCSGDYGLALAFAVAGMRAGVVISNCGPLAIAVPGLHNLTHQAGISLDIFNS